MVSNVPPALETIEANNIIGTNEPIKLFLTECLTIPRAILTGVIGIESKSLETALIGIGAVKELTFKITRAEPMSREYHVFLFP